MVNSFHTLVIVPKGSFLDVSGIHLYNFNLTGMHSEKLNTNRKTKKLSIILLYHELMLTYGYISYICLFKALAINKPFLQHHKGPAIFLNFFLDSRGYMTRTEQSMSKL